MTDGLQQRDLLHAADAAAACVALLDSGVTGAVNIGSGQPTTLLDVARCIARELDALPLLRPGFVPAREGDPAALYPDVGRLFREVGWTPSMSLEEGLRRSIAWWRSRSATCPP
jgi:nucleoside-diphosphate-sugar epimerase